MKRLPPKKEELLSEYIKLRNEFQIKILSDKETREKLKEIIEERKANNKSLAKLSNRFTNKIKGENKKISTRINQAYESNDWSKVSFDFHLLRSLQKYIKPGETKEKVRNIDNKLREIENTLVEELQSLAYYMPGKFSPNLLGLDASDLVQEANKGILKAIEKYDPAYIGKTKFTTYVYIVAEKKLKEYIMNKSRLISLPKGKLERIFILLEAGNHSCDSDRLVSSANKILHKKLNRPLKSNEIFTETEVLGLKTLLNASIFSLETPIGHKKSIKDVLLDPNSTPEKQVEKNNSLEHIKEILKNNLSETEWKIIYYKFLFKGEEITLKEVKDILLESEGIDYSRERINQLKHQALEKLKDQTELKEFLSG